jgi:hypothetical protein
LTLTSRIGRRALTPPLLGYRSPAGSGGPGTPSSSSSLIFTVVWSSWVVGWLLDCCCSSLLQCHGCTPYFHRIVPQPSLEVYYLEWDLEPGESLARSLSVLTTATLLP